MWHSTILRDQEETVNNVIANVHWTKHSTHGEIIKGNALGGLYSDCDCDYNFMNYY